jgi:hypothetical protein
MAVWVGKRANAGSVASTDGGGRQKGRNKFGARRSGCQVGHVHASLGEARRCDVLHLMQRAGEIRALEQQPAFFLCVDGRSIVDLRGRRLRYTADFRYEERDGAGGWRLVVEDFKGAPTMTEAAALRMAVFRACHPDIQLRVTGK